MRRLVPFLLLALASCAWTTSGNGPMMWLSYQVLKPDDSPGATKAWDPDDEYPPAQRPPASLDPTVLSYLLLLPALAVDLVALPVTSVWGAVGGPWDPQPGDRRAGGVETVPGADW